MKISCDDQELFTLTPIQIKCIENNIRSSECKADLHRRIKWVLMHKYEQCFKRLKEEWEQKLKLNGVTSIPLDEEEFCQLVFSQPNYKDREAREAESEEV